MVTESDDPPTLTPPKLVLGKNEVEARQAEDPLSDSGVSFIVTISRGRATVWGFIVALFLPSVKKKKEKKVFFSS